MLYAYRRYDKSNDYTLRHVYKEPSEAKIQAFERCVSISNNLSGERPYIISHNAYFFSVAFFAGHPETGELIFVVITPEKVLWCYDTELEELATKYS